MQPKNWIEEIKNIAESYNLIVEDLEKIEIFIEKLIKNLKDSENG